MDRGDSRDRTRPAPGQRRPSRGGRPEGPWSPPRSLSEPAHGGSPQPGRRSQRFKWRSWFEFGVGWVQPPRRARSAPHASRVDAVLLVIRQSPCSLWACFECSRQETGQKGNLRAVRPICPEIAPPRLDKLVGWCNSTLNKIEDRIDVYLATQTSLQAEGDGRRGADPGQAALRRPEARREQPRTWAASRMILTPGVWVTHDLASDLKLVGASRWPVRSTPDAATGRGGARPGECLAW
jgi:hypothetical protein